MSDAQVDEVEAEYLAHCRALRPKLAPATVELLDFSIHDGQVQEWAVQDDRFIWRLLVGDLQRGYEFLTMTYFEAEVVGGEKGLKALNLFAAGTELLCDELELLEDGRLMHRILVWPDGEIWVRFTSLQMERAPATPEARR